MNAIPFEFALACDTGRKRKGEPNQDTATVVLPEPGVWHPLLMMVADGLGGQLGGARASMLVTQIFQQEIRAAPHPTNYIEFLVHCARKAHEVIKLEAADDAKLSKMSSTIVAVILETDKIHLLNVGDSRAYILRGKKMIQISQDHSWVAEQVRNGILTAEQARRHPYRSRLTMAINAARSEIHPYTAQVDLASDDVILLCSDGLWGVVPESLICTAALELSPQAAVVKLVDMANRSHGPDNISVIIARQRGGA